MKREPATAEQAKAYGELMRAVYGIAPGVRVLIGGPLYDASPNACLRQAIAQADVIAFQSKFEPEETLSLIEREGITHAVMVPTMFVRLMRLLEETRRRYDVSSLRWVIHTGAPCAPEIKQALMDWWGPVIYETYGGTEVGAVMLSTPEDWLADPGSVGRLTPGARIALYGEDDKPVAPGEVGEIYVRQASLADFVYLNDAAKRKSVERDGLISVGDVGYFKNDRLYLCDRRSDMVISAGVNIYPAEIDLGCFNVPASATVPCSAFPTTSSASCWPPQSSSNRTVNSRPSRCAPISPNVSPNTRCRGGSISMQRFRARKAGRYSSAGSKIPSGAIRAGASS